MHITEDPRQREREQECCEQFANDNGTQRYLTNMKRQVCRVFLFVAFFGVHFDNGYCYNDVYEGDLACPYDRECLPVNYCPGLDTLMHRKAIPPQRFRVAVCGYEGVTAKVCCSVPRETSTKRTIPRFDCGTSTIPSSSPTVTVGSFPFLARIGFINVNTGETKYPCTGTIIDTRTILTTASCALAQADNYKLQTVLVGEFDTARNPDCNNMFCGPKPPCLKISYVVKHPRYDPKTFANNIALVRVEEPITFSATVQPACLYTGREFDMTETDQVRLFGWGKLSGETSPATKLRSVPMRLLSRRDCMEYTDRKMCVELCAIGEQEACAGFSGGPLIRVNRNKYTVIGILSYGSTCEDNRNSPVAFVDVQYYADWIAHN